MDALSDALRVLRLTGAVFIDAEFTAPWCVVSHSGKPTTPGLLSGPGYRVLSCAHRGTLQGAAGRRRAHAGARSGRPAHAAARQPAPARAATCTSPRRRLKHWCGPTRDRGILRVRARRRRGEDPLRVRLSALRRAAVRADARGAAADPARAARRRARPLPGSRACCRRERAKRVCATPRRRHGAREAVRAAVRRGDASLHRAAPGAGNGVARRPARPVRGPRARAAARAARTPVDGRGAGRLRSACRARRSRSASPTSSGRRRCST